jgi:pimeloyl-ACP methyl ester carboxylesterase
VYFSSPAALVRAPNKFIPVVKSSREHQRPKGLKDFMPHTKSGGASIWWKAQGEGDPILLIAGLGSSSDTLHRIITHLSSEYRTIQFDNRGAGRSDSPPGLYSIAEMAEDAVSVLDAASVNQAHVFGFSMGGMIAQELAFSHPHRVRSLILGGTNCGRPRAILAEPEVLEALSARAFTNPVDAFWAMVPYSYDASTPGVKIKEDLEVRRHLFPGREGYQAQLQAIIAWASCDRLRNLKVPTLVIHGDSDRLIPIGNAHLLASEISNAKLIELAHAGHIFLTDQTQATIKEIISFLHSVLIPGA